MAKHKKIGVDKSCTVIKTYKHKVVKNCMTEEEFNLYVEAMKEQSNYYNNASKWICSMLMKPISTLWDMMDEKTKSEESNYAMDLISDEWKDLPIYKMFMKPYNSIRCDNAIIRAIINTNVDGYNGNILKICSTSYRRRGYLDTVIANYRTSLGKIKPHVKYYDFSESKSPKTETLIDQCIYEIIKMGIKGCKDWEKIWVERIKFLEQKSERNEKIINRLNTLLDFYREHFDDVNGKYEKMCAELLVNFGGCTNTSRNSMIIRGSTPVISYIDDSVKEKMNGNTENTEDNKKKIPYDVFRMTFAPNINLILYGHKDIFRKGKFIDEEFPNSLCECFSISLMEKPGGKSDLIVNLSADTKFVNRERSFDKNVGIDVNTKHMLLQSDISGSEKIHGYLNIYKELLKDEEFLASCTKSEIETYREISQNVSFGLIEQDILYSGLFERVKIMNSDKTGKERFTVVHPKKDAAMHAALTRISQRYRKYRNPDPKVNENGEVVERDKKAMRVIQKKCFYIDSIIRMRNKMIAYGALYNAYYEEQSKYDLEHGKEYIEQNPFGKTEKALELINKRENVRRVIIGCRNNIIEYAYWVAERNGYGMIAMENLTTSNFEKFHGEYVPSTKSLLDHFKVLGCTETMLPSSEGWWAIEKGYYNLKYENGVVVGAELSNKGIAVKKRSDFLNLVPKMFHFAEIKDHILKVSNDNGVGVSLVPAEYSSQMDSIDHTIICEQAVNQKTGRKYWEPVDKYKVRPQQEKHINGLNADFNAARNIAHFMNDEAWRKKFLNESSTNAPMYKVPVCKPATNNKKGVIKNLKSIGAIKEYKQDLYKSKCA